MMQTGNRLPAETAPLLRPSVTNNDPESASAGASNTGNSSPQVEAATNGASGDLPKPAAVKMAILIPALSIGMFLVGLDNTLTVATYGKIGSDMQALNSTSWIATSLFLTLITFQPLYGKLSDIFGCKSCLLFAYVAFGFGCLGCGVARNIVELCIARAIVGAGGGGMNTLANIIITDLVPLRERGIWQGYLSIMFTAGMSAGAPLGGLFVDSIGWRWAFIFQCPIALLAFISVYFVLQPPRTDQLQWGAKIFRIDFIGAFTLASAVFLLLFGLDNGSNEGWSKKITVVPLVLAPVLFAILVFVEAKVAKEPFAPGHVIFDPRLLVAYGASFFGFAAQMGVYFFIALFYQATLGMSAAFSGLMYLPSTFFVLVGSLGGGFIVKRTGRFYWLTLTGYCLALLGIVPLVLGVGQKSAISTVIGLSILTFGINITFTTTLIVIIANVAPKDTAVAIACSFLFRSLGTTIGVSISTATLQQVLRVNLARELEDADHASEIEEKVRQSLDYIRRLDPDMANVVRRCYAIATQWAFIPVAIFAVFSIASSLFIKEKKLDR
ncbi:major facilitator superfamily domain-containing protein [Xylaria cubensis]|nr:major facilitator superfamily domain-containing protein [Xylaria cubensis]